MKVEFFVLFALCLSAFASSGEKVNVAVVPSDPGVYSSAELEFLAVQIESGILLSNEYQVVERAKLGSILAEHGLQSSGVCEQEVCGVELGRILGVNKMILFNATRNESEILLTAKLVNVQTGVIEKTEGLRAYGTFSQVASKKGKTLGRKLVGITLEEDAPLYQKKKFWISIGVFAAAIPVLFFATRPKTETKTTERQVRIQ